MRQGNRPLKLGPDGQNGRLVRIQVTPSISFHVRGSVLVKGVYHWN